jgi:hypothetical protein
MSSTCAEREACIWLARSWRACNRRLTATPVSAIEDISVEIIAIIIVLELI